MHLKKKTEREIEIDIMPSEGWRKIQNSGGRSSMYVSTVGNRYDYRGHTLIFRYLNPKEPGLLGGVFFGEMKFVLSNFSFK